MNNYAQHELELIEATCRNESELKFQKMIDENILELFDLFSTQGHSGSSAAYVIKILTRLLNFKPILPLTGKDDEWEEPQGPQNIQQNRRCNSVFRKNFDNTTAGDIDGKIFTDDGKSFYRSRDSEVPVTFPYYPPDNPEIVNLTIKSDMN